MVHMVETAPNLQEPLGLDLDELSRPLKEMGDKAAMRVDVVVQIDTPTGVSKRFKLTRRGPVVLEVCTTDPANTLRSFVESTVEDDDPRSCALVIWGHSTGISQGVQRSPSRLDRAAPHPAGLARRTGGSGHSPVGMARAGSVWTQIAALPKRKKLDLVGFDACYMAGAEIAYELREHVDFLLAPQAGIGLEGWHYDLLLDRIVADDPKAISPEDLGRAVVQQVGLTNSSPQALTLLDLRRVEELVGPLRDLTTALASAYDAPNREPQMRKWILDAFSDATWVGVRQFLDLVDLCRLLASRIPDREVRTRALAVIAVLSKSPGLITDHLSALEIPLCGLSLYCPWPRATDRLLAIGVANVQVDKREYVGDDYDAKRFPGVALSKDTGWGELVFDDRRLQEAERRWVRQEVRDQAVAFSVAAEAAKAGGHARGDEPKPAGRGDEPKPAGRGDEPKPAGRSDFVDY
jgi:hypothetical protein